MPRRRMSRRTPKKNIGLMWPRTATVPSCENKCALTHRGSPSMTANERRDLWRLFQRQGKTWEEFVAAGETPEEQVARFDTQHENFVADLPPQESDEAFMTRVFGY